ncbi:hypothetical protein FQN53_000614 [Emmonsiellopsis sp. PD_33]|nr:hypothetical protein FQN53_000614 [Emmonsiellopsis sp. PD_33]
MAYAALGDSYASGIDAGIQLHPTCWRFSDSYPMQLIRTGLLGRNHAFQFLACSGSVMGLVGGSSSRRKSISAQIKSLKTADLVTLSIGGNDARFFDVLNACVYRFYGTKSGNCNERLQESVKIISDERFEMAYNWVLDEIMAKSGDAPHFRIMALGYSPFFDEALTEDCNNQSFGFWSMSKPKLTVQLRRQLNDISAHLNNRIAGIIKDRADEKVIWVNWAPKFKEHLFCQPGKPASDGDSTWFYDADFRSSNSTSNEIDIETCMQQTLDTGDWGERAACGIAVVQQDYPHMMAQGSGTTLTINRYPNQPGLARVFHPKPHAYAVIANEIRNHWPFISLETDTLDDSKAPQTS